VLTVGQTIVRRGLGADVEVIMIDSSHGVRGWERRTLWTLLVLSLLGLALAAVHFVRQWHVLAAGDVHGLSQSALTLAALALLIAAWALAIVLAARLRRWGWLIACALFYLAIPAFAVVVLVEPRPRRIDSRRRVARTRGWSQP
jgi:hypothetical protein